ncbi:hypothetical protein [Sinomicrobium weinanense]|uniref:Uncharacterized protein n=1 Tax=Sinomicrobium weinanense TaxID=2842200 RepID=A0A926JTR9_9FLAO|nr:hypothetical protein [Sinomicrobium weinanense]MBC9797221.1 hypothetical protein [Sinomicrobium weinanense]MBU3125566.1 hypothetical protein [Sinomicrobium weinanense]
MKFQIPIPLPSSLNRKELEIFHSLNQETYGLELARKVAGKLKQHPTRLNENGYYVGGGGLYHSHRDYCGIGLYFFEGKFTLGEVNDAMGPCPVLITFDEEEEFVEWLANQSDQSMSLMVRNDHLPFNFNNQTITKIRLEYFLEEEYDPVWNSYGAYVKKRKINE